MVSSTFLQISKMMAEVPQTGTALYCVVLEGRVRFETVAYATIGDLVTTVFHNITTTICLVGRDAGHFVGRHYRHTVFHRCERNHLAVADTTVVDCISADIIGRTGSQFGQIITERLHAVTNRHFRSVLDRVTIVGIVNTRLRYTETAVFFDLTVHRSRCIRDIIEGDFA